MYSKIMIAVDESKSSERALNEAIGLAQSLKATLYIANVIDISLPDLRESPIMMVDLKKYQDIIRKKADLLLKKFEKKAKQRKVKCQINLLEITDHSRVSERILKALKVIKPDLLIMGTHGRQGLNRFLIGSVALDVTSLAKMPVLLIRAV